MESKKPIRKPFPSRDDDVMVPDYGDAEPREGFDIHIQQVVGRVEYGEGTHNAHEAAFLVVARHDTPGEYTWTQNDGITTKLVVEYQMPESKS